jgi:hypothetical protein
MNPIPPMIRIMPVPSASGIAGRVPLAEGDDN